MVGRASSVPGVRSERVARVLQIFLSRANASTLDASPASKPPFQLSTTTIGHVAHGEHVCRVAGHGLRVSAVFELKHILSGKCDVEGKCQNMDVEVIEEAHVPDQPAKEYNFKRRKCAYGKPIQKKSRTYAWYKQQRKEEDEASIACEGGVHRAHSGDGRLADGTCR